MKFAWKLLAIWVPCLALGGPGDTCGEDPAIAADDAVRAIDRGQLLRLRKAAAGRSRRIIFNNDGCDAVYNCKEATPEALLECRTKALVGTQVDTIFYCTWCSGFSNFTHRTKLGSVFTCKEDQLSNNKTAEFVQQGTDPLKIMVDFCRQHEIEIFWSMRMNDTHDASGAWYGPLLFPQWKKDHPELLLGNRGKWPKNAQWTAVDYGHSEVRELAFRFVEEVCRNYNVDGVELDFFRHLNYFRRPAMGEDAAAEEREMMTGLLRRIRKMTVEVGRRRGRPILVAVRVPDSVEYCNALGFDLVRWMEEDLIDILVPSGYFRLNPWEVSVRLGHKHGVRVYPCLSESRLKGEARRPRASLECYRARAANVWDSGADGVYMFNYFDPNSPLWSELGEPDTLEALDKTYLTDARGLAAVNRWLADGTRFLNRSPVSPERPLRLEPGKTAAVELRVGRCAERPGPEPTAPKVTLRLQVMELAEGDVLSVSLNGKPLTGGTRSAEWSEYPVEPKLLRQGSNRFEILLGGQSTSWPSLHDLLLNVRYPDPG